MPRVEIDGVGIHYVDEGEGAPVVFLHGEPTWSFLWRKVIPPVRDAGFRCIAPDMAGFGRSDKPTDVGWYSYDRHTELIGSLVERLDLRDATIVVHDWGGPVGMRVFVEAPERFARLVAMDTGLFTGHQPMSEAWLAFRAFVQRTEDLPISMLVRNGTARGIDDETAARYDEPFPDAASKAGARAFPLMIPLTPSDAGAEAGRRVLAALASDARPKLVLWADGDPILPVQTGRRFAAAIGAPAPEIIADASHFLQEDAGDEIGRRIAAWLAPGPT